MIERGCDIEDTDADGFTPWLIAARWARTDVLQARRRALCSAAAHPPSAAAHPLKMTAHPVHMTAHPLSAAAHPLHMTAHPLKCDSSPSKRPPARRSSCCSRAPTATRAPRRATRPTTSPRSTTTARCRSGWRGRRAWTWPPTRCARTARARRGSGSRWSSPRRRARRVLRKGILFYY